MNDIHTDPATGRQYTHDRATGVSTWVDPTPDMPDPGIPDAAPRRHTLRNFLIAGAIGLFGIMAIGALAGGGGQQLGPVVTEDTPAVTTPAPTETTPTPTARAVQAAKPRPVHYKTLTAREWKLIARDPDAHAGEAITVYGQVTQFDAATGDDMFLASADGIRHPVQFGFVDYPTNTVFTGSPDLLGRLVEGDIFRIHATVVGSYSYDTQIGGNTTVPQLAVRSITRLGSAQ